LAKGRTPDPVAEPPEQKPAGKKTDALSTREGRALLKAAGNEVLRLYLLIEPHKRDAPDDLENKTKELCKESHSTWKYIKIEYLDDPYLYQLKTIDKEKRDFIGRLLRKILRDKNIFETDYQELYRKYLKVK
jgi:hypothetical protein